MSGRGTRSRRSAPRRRTSRRRVWPRVLAVLAGLAAIGLAAAVAVVKLVELSLPPVPAFAEYAERVPKVSRVLAADGTVVAEFFTERRSVMRPDAIPETLRAALIATEDAGFHEHEGVSWAAIARAALANAWRGKVTQGGSTITQQVVKQVLLSPERTYERKFRELLLARQVEQRLAKNEILAIYMTEVYLGHGRYGFEEASRFFFGKPASDLALPEAAMLAGLVSSPEGNSPVRNPVGAVHRQRYVLERMRDLGWISPDQARDAASERIPLLARDAPRVGAAPYFTDAVRREVTRLFGEGRLLHDGLTVETTLDLDASDAAEAAVATGLSRLWAGGRTREADEAAAIAAGVPGAEHLLDGTDEMIEKLPAPPRAVRARVVRCDPEHGVMEVDASGLAAALDVASLARLVLGGRPDPWAWCREARELPVSLANGEARVGDRTLPLVNAELGPQASMVVLDPGSRAVLALVGGEDHGSRPFNRAIQSRRPIGSVVKPFLYAAALAGGMDPGATFPNTAIRFRGAGGRGWQPRNYEGGYDGRDYGIAEALAKSVNVIAVRAMAAIGPGPVVELLAALGIPGAPADLSLALGSAEASPLALANAFAAFASGGTHDTPYFIARVRDHDGRVLVEHQRRPSRQVPAHVADTLRGMMRQAVLTGTAKRAASLPVPAWGKTGTTNRSRETWFAGSDGRRVVVVQVAYDDRLPMRGATGGDVAVPFFADFVRIASPR